MSAYRAETLKVWHPDRGVKTVNTIASVEDHYGNLVAEGDMPQDQFWPSVVGDYRARLLIAEQHFVDQRDEIESAVYAELWVNRYLRFLAGLEQQGAMG